MARRPILVLTTGGTFDKQYFDALSDYRITDTIVAQMLEVGRNQHPVEVREVMRKDSLELGDDDRALLRRHVAEADTDRVVIVHGTDTMAQTARTLAEVAGKTIVLTGALTPARFAVSDAAFNLGMAFAAAQVAAPGIYIAMNGTVFDALAVRKDRDKGAFVAT